MPFSLIANTWLPVRLQDGSHSTIRPAELVAYIADNPVLWPDWPRADLNIATLELLIGMLQVAFAPKDIDDWLDRYEEPPSVAELDEALAFISPHLDLDGDGPRFMQDYSPLEGDLLSLDGLFIDSSGGNAIKKNADLMVKRERYSNLSPAAAAISLYALQQFAPAGGAGHRTSMRGGGPFTTAVIPPSLRDNQPATLWHIVWSNLLYSPQRPKAEQLPLIFPWLARTLTSENKKEIHQADSSVHDYQYYFGQPRRIRLVIEENTSNMPCALTGSQSETTVTGYVTRPSGVNYGRWTHPLSPYYRMKAGEDALPLHPPAGDISYRNWAALVIGTTDGLRTAAQSVQLFRNDREHQIPVTSTQDSRILAAGWAMSNMKPLDFLATEQPLHNVRDLEQRRMLDQLAARMLAAADAASIALRSAVQEAIKTGKDKPGADKTRITAVYESFYAETESAFHNLLNEAAKANGENLRDKLAEQWLQKIVRTAFNLFDETVTPDPTHPDKARKAVDARRQLANRLLYAKYPKSLRKVLSLPELPKKGKAA